MTSIMNRSPIELFAINTSVFFKDFRSYVFQINLNTIPNYHTKECGIYMIFKKRSIFDMGGSSSRKSTYKLSISYIDANNYKQELFNTEFTPMQFEENLSSIDKYDYHTRYGVKEISTAMKKFNCFFNDDRIGTEYIKKYGIESIFAVELTKYTET